MFCYENKLVFPIYVSDQIFKNSIDLLLLIDENKSHYLYIKDFDRFMFHKTKTKNNQYFCKSCLQCFSSKNVLTQHKEVCLSINGPQSVRFEKGTIEFKIISNKHQFHSKFMLTLSIIEKVLKVMKVLTQKSIKITFLAVLLTNLFVLMINLITRLLFLEVKMLLTNLLK